MSSILGRCNYPHLTEKKRALNWSITEAAALSRNVECLSKPAKLQPTICTVCSIFSVITTADSVRQILLILFCR